MTFDTILLQRLRNTFSISRTPECLLEGLFGVIAPSSAALAGPGRRIFGGLSGISNGALGQKVVGLEYWCDDYAGDQELLNWMWRGGLGGCQKGEVQNNGNLFTGYQNF